MTEQAHSTRHRRQGGRPHAADRVLIEQRREQVATLLLSGASYRQIAALLDVGRATVGDDVGVIRRQWREKYAADYDAVVSEEAAKLDALERKWFPVALSSSDDASTATTLLLRISERRSRLMGLDRPVRVEHTGKDGGPIEVEDVAAQAEMLVDELAAKRAALAG